MKGFICLNAHPTGCAVNVQRQVALASRETPGAGLGDTLVVGSSTGYGLSSLIVAAFGYGARTLGVCLERPAQGDRTASAGWYNVAAVHRLARQQGRAVATLNGDAFTNEVRAEAVRELKQRGAKLSLVVYSVASPRRTDPTTGTAYTSVLKPIGAPFRSRTIHLSNGQIAEVDIEPATDAEIESTRKVMGGEDWALWVNTLLEEGLLAPGCRTIAYSYVGPELTYPIYRSGTIGRAKADLEQTGRALDRVLSDRVGGHAYVSVNKALATQASAAIPVVPLYISLLYKVMKAKGTHEGTAEQTLRLFRSHIGPGVTPALDGEGRIRLDDLELAPAVQTEVLRLWDQVTAENLAEISDYAGFRSEFRQLFGFEVPGVDYGADVEITPTVEPTW